ncbi:MAG: hypothetical protein ACXW3U_14830, partial [Rhodoplanes sp.]
HSLHECCDHRARLVRSARFIDGLFARTIAGAGSEIPAVDADAAFQQREWPLRAPSVAQTIVHK